MNTFLLLQKVFFKFSVKPHNHNDVAEKLGINPQAPGYLMSLLFIRRMLRTNNTAVTTPIHTTPKSKTHSGAIPAKASSFPVTRLRSKFATWVNGKPAKAAA